MLRLSVGVFEELASQQPHWLEPFQRSPPGFALLLTPQHERRIVVFFATFKKVVWFLPFVHADGKRRSVSLEDLRGQLLPAARHIQTWQESASFAEVAVNKLEVVAVPSLAENMFTVEITGGSRFPPKPPSRKRGAASTSTAAQVDALKDAELEEGADALANAAVDGESMASSDETCLDGEDEVVGEGAENPDVEVPPAVLEEDAELGDAVPPRLGNPAVAEVGLVGGMEGAVQVGGRGDGRHARGTFVAWSNGYFTLSHGEHYVTVRAHPRLPS